jgi:hypothetical protein
MATASITWSSATSVTADSNVNSDVLDTDNTMGFSATVLVSGTSSTGISGNLSIQVSNDNTNWVTLAGSVQTVLVGNGSSMAFAWSFETFYEYARLVWVVGSYAHGTLSDGIWAYTNSPVLPVQAHFVKSQSLPMVLNQALPIGTSTQPNPYGVDINCLNDLDPYFSLVGGIQCLAQDLYHLVTCPTGSLFWAPSLCFDSRGMLGQSVTQSELGIIQSNMTNAIQADQRVQNANVVLQFNYSTEALVATISVQPYNPQGSSQPFTFVASIAAAGNNLLSISPSLAA